MMNRLLLCVVLVACGKTAEPGADKGNAPLDELIERKVDGVSSSASVAGDWSNKPLDATIESKVKGIAFKLAVPAGFKFQALGNQSEDDPGLIAKRWRPDVANYLSEPSVSVSFVASTPTNMRAFTDSAMLDMDKNVIAKQETTPDGFVMLTHTTDKATVRAHVVKPKGDVAVACRAHQTKMGGVPNPDATMAWLEKLCASLTLL
ncbi:MAG TPA: hypothetical protein VIV11_12145 [Kofleriaceae bacterium]